MPGTLSSTGLRYFAEVVRRGSLRVASESLCVAASAISRQISLLEEDLGAPLFESHAGRRQQRLTAAGEQLMSFIQDQDNETRRVRASIQALKGLHKGQIKFGIPETFIHHLIPNVLLRFNEKYPDITFYIEVANTPRLLELVKSGRLDFIIAYNPPKTAGVANILEIHLDRHLIVNERHPLYGRSSIRLSDIAEYKIALPSSSLTAKAIDDAMFAKSGIAPNEILQTNSYELIHTVAMAGLSVAIGNGDLLEYETDAARQFYRCVPIKDPRVKASRLTLAIQEGRTLPVTATTFVSDLKNELSTLGKLITHHDREYGI